MKFLKTDVQKRSKGDVYRGLPTGFQKLVAFGDYFVVSAFKLSMVIFGVFVPGKRKPLHFVPDPRKILRFVYK